LWLIIHPSALNDGYPEEWLQTLKALG